MEQRASSASRIQMPNHPLHAAIHTVVENQIAEGGDIPARETLLRLMDDGLDRHEAVHAIGCVLAEHIHDMMKSKTSLDANSVYFQKLRELAAEKWKRIGQQ